MGYMFKISRKGKTVFKSSNWVELPPNWNDMTREQRAAMAKEMRAEQARLEREHPPVLCEPQYFGLDISPFETIRRLYVAATHLMFRPFDSVEWHQHHDGRVTPHITFRV